MLLLVLAGRWNQPLVLVLGLVLLLLQIRLICLHTRPPRREDEGDDEQDGNGPARRNGVEEDANDCAKQ